VSRDKWIEIDIDAVENNLQAVRVVLADKARLIAVVKANAYGHGAEEIARILSQNGVDFFAVSFVEEAMQLRKAGIKADILVFSPVGSEIEAMESIKNQLTLTITSDKDRELLERAAASTNQNQVRVHLKIDTGLGRFGMNEDEAIQVCQNIQQNDSLYIEGIYSHIADPASSAYTQEQFRKFVQAVKRLEDEKITIPIKHFANSSVFLAFPNMYLDAVRIGTLLSGQHPVGHFSAQMQLKDPYKFKSRIISIRTLKKDSYLGYYRT
jgi:alanine racemase